MTDREQGFLSVLMGAALLKFIQCHWTSPTLSLQTCVGTEEEELLKVACLTLIYTMLMWEGPISVPAAGG